MKKKVVIIGAMPSELVDIRAALPNSEIVKKQDFRIMLMSWKRLR